MPGDIEVEVVFAATDRQRLVKVTLPPGACVADAIEKSEMAKHFPSESLDILKVGIWGRVVPRDKVLCDGDRVEIYRPLSLDPREARRQLAAMGRTMKGSGEG